MVESANIETKIRRAQAFWNRAAVDRPMIGFSWGQIVVESPEEANSLAEFLQPWN